MHTPRSSFYPLQITGRLFHFQPRGRRSYAVELLLPPPPPPPPPSPRIISINCLFITKMKCGCFLFSACVCVCVSWSERSSALYMKTIFISIIFLFVFFLRRRICRACRVEHGKMSINMQNNHIYVCGGNLFVHCVYLSAYT